MDAVKVKTLPNGNTVDQLMDLDIVEGETLEILWPDAVPFPPITESFKVHLDHECGGKHTRAYVVVPFHGTTNRVYLRYKKGTMVRRAQTAAKLLALLG